LRGGYSARNCCWFSQSVLDVRVGLSRLEKFVTRQMQIVVTGAVAELTPERGGDLAR